MEEVTSAPISRHFPVGAGVPACFRGTLGEHQRCAPRTRALGIPIVSRFDGEHLEARDAAVSREIP
jgi:hypothetical protein